MAQITSLENCFNYKEELIKITPQIQETIERLKQEAAELEKNDMYYGSKSYSCGDYTPIKNKMDTIIKYSIPAVCTDLKNLRASIQKIYYTKAKNDLNEYISYIENKFLNPNTKAYNSVNNALKYSNGRINNIFPKYSDFERQSLIRGYQNYKKYQPYKEIAKKRLEELERVYNCSMEGQG